MDIIDIGSAKLDPKTNVLTVSAKASPVGDDPDDAPSYDETPIAGQLGVTAKPFPKNQEGNAQGVVDESLPGSNGWVVAARDTRSFVAKIVEELGDGEVAMHSIGPGFDSRVFCKNQMVALIVGDDAALVIDRKNKRFTFTGFGGHIENSQENGIQLQHGGGGLSIKDGVVALIGDVVLGGTKPNPAMCIALCPPTGSPGGPASTPLVAAKGVWIGF